MAVMRVEKTKNYTIIANYHLNDERLSLKAKGLLSFMLSKPDKWDYSLNGLISQVKEGKTADISALKELKQLGYLEVTRTNGADGRYEYIYDIYEKPKSSVPSPAPKKPSTQNQSMEIVPQVNTDKANTDKVRTERKNVATAKAAATPPSLEEERELEGEPKKPERLGYLRTPEEEEPDSFALAKRLRQLILTNKPNRKIPKDWATNWPQEIRRLHRIDGRSYEDIRKVLDWSQQDPFWKRNILSGRKLRQKFDTLEDQMAYEAEQKRSRQSNYINLNEI